MTHAPLVFNEGLPGVWWKPIKCIRVNEKKMTKNCPSLLMSIFSVH